MGLNNFDYWSKQIVNSNFSYSIEEEKIVRAVDLDRFIDCYDPSIRIMDCVNNDVCIVKDKSVMKEVTLLDLKNVEINDEKTFNLDHQKNNESWIVFVNDKFDFVLNEATHFIESNNLLKIYDKIFLFNFFQSTIKELK
ncbi:hypothetical protein [Chishuiella sp.]|uniref:hypothetical protein n=1 Tax=Chishuiella sp. TaxID=1969467 RepID=UPI0028AB332C|nr:hypothetical protein [Chishuiella sp.]